ncbi:aspartic proteinase CDR1-like [Quercus lobata]|uniref:aspartic proteinase CDR1-like n=1 Tax=Quercus lobata TaxID=97700 RepID=UPI001243DFC3|nr:aspartic proteinase CDR1-like [Quercus lobata]
MDLIHRDSPNSPFYNASETHSQHVAKALHCSINRLNRFKPTSSVPPNSLQADFISDSGEYLLNYSIGCGHNNNDTGESKASTGIVGLGGDKASLVSQLHSSIGGKFSYCLVPSIYPQDNTSSRLSFGSHAVVSGFGTVSTPLEYERSDTFYNLTLEAMSVGSKRL